jgi:hypothetical protein
MLANNSVASSAAGCSCAEYAKAAVRCFSVALQRARESRLRWVSERHGLAAVPASPMTATHLI